MSDAKPEETKEPTVDHSELMPNEELDATDGTGSKLELVKTATGEEQEECIWKARAKAYRFDEGENEWKERGVGEMKFLKDKESGRVRMLMRREMIHKICVCINLKECAPLKEHAENNKAWVFSGMDYSEEEDATRETICIKFTTPENAKAFKENFIALGGPEN
eukprot:TRINITY_DN4195_c0_g1_i1.p2 TRINITY_DN4195_c0_g1~~TRINITY_DN4195_c0_g1_i1.p2  ORF type:complete len:164 (+),score=84.15 TRINITY_DN4195_c0_g1_i1:102-593(+)